MTDLQHIRLQEEPDIELPQKEEGKFIDEDINQINTLEEPVTTTLLRDMRMVAMKLKYVIIPKQSDDACKELRNWDLWGPLFLCVTMSLTLTLGAKDTVAQKSDQIFALVFFLIWAGAVLITLNIKCLGAHISLFQSICVIGYCIFPICIALLVNTLLKAAIPFLFRLLISAVAVIWATLCNPPSLIILACSSFIASIVPKEVKLLATYPCLLYYIFLGFLSALI